MLIPNAFAKMHSFLSLCTFAFTTLFYHAIKAECPCGWRVEGQHRVYTHHMHENFDKYEIDVDSILNNPLASKFNDDWMIYDY